jgi:hypothetical protein
MGNTTLGTVQSCPTWGGQEEIGFSRKNPILKGGGGKKLKFES